MQSYPAMRRWTSSGLLLPVLGEGAGGAEASRVWASFALVRRSFLSMQSANDNPAELIRFLSSFSERESTSAAADMDARGEVPRCPDTKERESPTTQPTTPYSVLRKKREYRYRVATGNGRDTAQSETEFPCQRPCRLHVHTLAIESPTFARGVSSSRLLSQR